MSHNNNYMFMELNICTQDMMKSLDMFSRCVPHTLSGATTTLPEAVVLLRARFGEEEKKEEIDVLVGA